MNPGLDWLNLRFYLNSIVLVQTLVSNFSWNSEKLTPSSRPERWSQSAIILHTTTLQSATCPPKWSTGSKVYV